MKLIFEGIQNINDEYIINFEQDSVDDIISVVKPTIYKSNFYDNLYWFGYKFNNNISSSERTHFINWLKGINGNPTQHELDTIIAKPVNALIKEIGFDSIKLIIYPESQRSKLVNSIIDVIGSVLPHNIKGSTISVIKNIPSQIEFDWDLFDKQFTGNEISYKQTQEFVNGTLLPAIHKLDYFSIAKNVKPKYRPFIQNYLTIDNIKSKNILDCIVNNRAILIVDDINTSGSTLKELIRLVKTLDSKSDIYIFTLIGK